MIENSDYTKVGDGFLLIERLVSADEGVYQCIAKNSLGDIQDTAELFVYKRGRHLMINEKLFIISLNFSWNFGEHF